MLNLKKYTVLALVFAGLSAAAQKSKPLFDGKTLTGWKAVAGAEPYKVEDGMIVGTMTKGTPNSFLITEKEYGDFILELDVKLEGRGQQWKKAGIWPAGWNRSYSAGMDRGDLRWGQAIVALSPWT